MLWAYNKLLKYGRLQQKHNIITIRASKKLLALFSCTGGKYFVAEQTKQQVGDGKDNYGQAAKNMAKAAKGIGKAAANTAKEGAKATANVAAQTVKAGIKTGKAVSQIAAGTAAGGPWGAIISAAWSMRHTLFKIFISVTLVIVFLVVAILSIPSIIFDTIFGNKFEGIDGQTAIVQAYDELSNTVDDIIEVAFELTLGRVDDIITGGNYDYSMSMKNLSYTRPTNNDYDTYYIIAAYSVSMNQQGTSQENFTNKLNSVSDLMFPLKYEICKANRIIDTLLGPIDEIFEYVVCTILPFDLSSILTAFDLDLNAQYGEFDITNGEAVEFMATALEKTLNEGV